MGEGSKVLVGARIDKGVWEEFIKFVEAKYGRKARGFIGFELESAIRSYIVGAQGGQEVISSEYIEKTIRSILDKILTEKIEEIVDDRLASIAVEIEEIKKKLSSEHQNTVQQPRDKKATAIEVIREKYKGVVFEDEIVDVIKDRDRYFNKIKEEGCHVLVLENVKQRVAFTPEFWAIFVRKINENKGLREEELRKKLNKRESKLFTLFKEDGILIWNGKEWIWAVGPEDLLGKS